MREKFWTIGGTCIGCVVLLWGWDHGCEGVVAGWGLSWRDIQGERGGGQRGGM